MACLCLDRGMRMLFAILGLWWISLPGVCADKEELFEAAFPVSHAAKDIPGLELITPDWASAHGLQFGPSSNDVLYLILGHLTGTERLQDAANERGGRCVRRLDVFQLGLKLHVGDAADSLVVRDRLALVLSTALHDLNLLAPNFGVS